jgi:hypothetical protein
LATTPRPFARRLTYLGHFTSIKMDSGAESVGPSIHGYVSANDKAIFDTSNARNGPGSPFGHTALMPRMNLAFERYFGARYVDVNAAGLDLRAALERIFNAELYVEGTDARPHGDQIAHCHDARKLANGVFGVNLLIIPLDFAGQGDPSVLDCDLYFVVRNGHVPTYDVQCSFGNLIIAGFLGAGMADFDLLRDPTHSLDALNDALGRHLLGIASDMACQGRNSVVHGDSYVRCIDARFELEFVHDVLAQANQSFQFSYILAPRQIPDADKVFFGAYVFNDGRAGFIDLDQGKLVVTAWPWSLLTSEAAPRQEL